ncbi:MAG TPA: cytochrome c maturation protein CcmE [Candidatus Saccharimonadales bacterium]|nr:cytochrome c maturation protein CcmE [Candidatus Saccharimonadales bacterium]
MSNSLRLTLVSLLVVASVGWLIVTEVKHTGMQYMTVTELARLDHAPKAEGFRLDGTVAPGSVVYDQKIPTLRFKMTDGKEKIAVVYDGLMPDAFADGREVVVEGAYRHDDRALHATKLVTKCPSKYEAQGLGKDKT